MVYMFSPMVGGVRYSDLPTQEELWARYSMEAPERPRQWVWQDEDASEAVRNQSEAGEWRTRNSGQEAWMGPKARRKVEGRKPARTKFKK